MSFGLFRLAKVWRLSHVAFRLGLVRFGWASSGGLVRVCSVALGYGKMCFGG